MSLKSREAGKLAIAGLAAAAAFGTAASSAQAAKLTQNYQCKYPLIGVQPLKIDIDAAIPSQWQVGENTPTFVIDAVATAGGSTAGAMQLIGAQSIEGSSIASAVLTKPEGNKINLNVPIAVANWNKSTPKVPNPLVLNAQGATPPLVFDVTGNAGVVVNSIKLNLTARNAAGQAIPLKPVETDLDGKAVTASDNDPGTFDVPCKLVAGQPTTLTNIKIDENGSSSSDTSAPSKPGNLKATSTGTSTSLTWNASTDNVGVIAYDVLRNGQPVTTVSKTSASIPGLTPSTSSQYSVVAIDAARNQTSSDTITASTPANVVNNAALANYNAALGGTATMKTLITGNLPLEGTIGAQLTTIDGKINADLNLLPRTGRLNALGFLPVTAKVGFVSSGKTTGDLSADGVLTTTSKLRIKLIEVKLFGAIPIAGGNNCQTTQLSTIVLKSKANFDPVVGGAISGTFAISNLNGCGILNGLVSPLTAGGGNVINATLKPTI